MRRIASQSGNIAFYFALLLPLVTTASIVVVDVSGWQMLRARAQREADRLVLQAARLLPDVSAAQSFLRDGVAADAVFRVEVDESGVEKLSVSREEVSLSLVSEYPSVFDYFLAPRNGKTFFRASASAVSQKVPSDVVLVVSDSASLRPEPFEAWGDPREWPTASYFDLVRLPCESSQDQSEVPLREVCQNDKRREYQRWATQACFNPVLTPLKRAAISLVDLYGASQRNRLSVLFTPSENTAVGYSVIRPLEFSKEAGDWAQAGWSDYFESENVLSDELCLYFSNRATSRVLDYPLPAVENSFRFAGFSVNESCPQLKTGVYGALHWPIGNIEPCYLRSQLQLREAIFFRLARRYSHQQNFENVSRALIEAANQFQKDSERALERSRRGGLAGRAHRRVVVLSDGLPSPRSATMKTALDFLSSLQAEVVFISYLHAGLNDEQRRLLIGNSKEFAALSDKGFRVVLVEGGVELLSGVASRILTLKQEVSLRL